VIVFPLTYTIHLFVVLATWISSCIMDFFLQPNIIYHKYIMGCLEYLFICELKNISLHLFFIPAKSKLFIKGWVQYVFILGLEGCASSCAMAPTTYYSCGHLTRHEDWVDRKRKDAAPNSYVLFAFGNWTRILLLLAFASSDLQLGN
jgi:hypothetical protein